MAGHQLKKLAQSRGKSVRSSLIDAVPKHWSVYTLLFSTVFLLLFCFLLFDIRTSPTALLLHATSHLGALRAQAGELYSQSTGSSSAEYVVNPSWGKGTQHQAEESGGGETDQDEENQTRKPKSLEKGIEELSGENESTVEVEDNVPNSQKLSRDSKEDDTDEKPGKKGVKIAEKEVEDPGMQEKFPTEEPEEPEVEKESRGEVPIDIPEVLVEKESIQEVPENIAKPDEGEESDEDSFVLEDKVEKKKDAGNKSRSKKKTVKKEETSGEEVLKEVIPQGKCDYSVGQWVYDESYPLYKPDTCPFVDGGFRCVENGRPSAEFQKYRWQPAGCNLPRFDPKFMLEKLRGRRLAFVGDSIGRNNWESLLCMLSEAVSNKSRIYEINGEPITKHKGFLSFKFEDYNCTVEYYRSPYLVPQGRAPPNSPPEVHSTFKLDLIDWSANLWKDADILIFNAGHWWSFEKTIRDGNYFQIKDKVRKEMEVGDAFKRAMKTVAKYVDENVDPQRTQVFWRSYAPVHFRGGTWKTGGSCIDEERPMYNLTNYQEPWVNHMVTEVTQKNVRTPIIFLNVTFASDHRADGHSSVWQRQPPSPINRQDCSHWCLPGVPDTWNEFLYATLIDRRQGPWADTTL